MQRYDFYLILPNFYTLFCYPEITFYTVDAHTGRKLTIPNTIERYLTNLKVRHDVAMATSRRSARHVAT